MSVTEVGFVMMMNMLRKEEGKSCAWLMITRADHFLTTFQLRYKKRSKTNA